MTAWARDIMLEKEQSTTNRYKHYKSGVKTYTYKYFHIYIYIELTRIRRKISEFQAYILYKTKHKKGKRHRIKSAVIRRSMESDSIFK